jgi:hypothetical protein
MEERGNKTIICSVFFLDIIEYSKKSVTDQISLKERFNTFLSTAIRDVPINDRIILDTGDGAAISFLGDIEDALRAALSVRSSLLSEEGLSSPSLQVRMGVNLGPVRLVRDINGQPNLVGDGINVAQRIMGFASAGQILVSRSYYDAASRLSHDYAGMFHYEGARTDKHVREHEVYAIGYPGDFTGTQKRFQAKSESKFAEIIWIVRGKARRYWAILQVWQSETRAHLREVFDNASNNKKALYIGAIALPVLLLVLLVIRFAYLDDEPAQPAPKAVVATTPIVVASSGVSLVSPRPSSHVADAAAKQVQAVQASTSKPSEVVANSAINANKQETKEIKDTKETKEVIKSDSFKVVASSVVAKANVILKIKPWGEVYVDGKMVGVSPPLTKLQVDPGEHVIEVRNTTFPVSTRVVNIKTGMKITVKHKFGN